MKKISIIIPTLNSQKTIKIALKSIFNQSYKNFEIIIIDAFSKDNTLKIIKSFKNKKIKIFNVTKKKGLSYARFYGIKKSSGTLIAFLDSDDYWHKNKLLIQIRSIQNYNFCSTGFSIIKNNKKMTFLNYPKFLDLKKLIYDRPIANSSVLVDKKLIYQIAKKYRHVKFAEDYLWWIAIMKKIKKTLFINKNLTYLRISPTGRTINNFFNNFFSLYIIYKNILKFSIFKIFFIYLILIKNIFKKKYFYYFK